MKRSEFLRLGAIAPALPLVWWRRGEPTRAEIEAELVRVGRMRKEYSLILSPWLSETSFGWRENALPCPNCEHPPRRETPRIVYWYPEGTEPYADNLMWDMPGDRRWCLCGYAEWWLPGERESWSHP